MTSQLKRKFLAALGWSSVDAFFRQGFQFAISVMLARLLAPEEFGLIAMLSLFFAVAGVFAETVFPAALIQRQGLTPLETSSVFYFNIGMGLAASIATFLAALGFLGI